MNREFGCVILTLLFISCQFPAILTFPTAKADDTVVYIFADGTISPPNVPIKREGELYTFYDDVNATSVIVERSGITIDGAFYTLTGPGRLNGTAGFYLDSLLNISIKRMKITNFYFGIQLFQCADFSLIENELTNNTYGVYPNWCNNSLIFRDKIMNNGGGGIYLTNSFNISVEYNLLASNSFYAMRITHSHNGTFIGNSIANNYGSGIHMRYSNHNLVYYNNFVNNVQDAINTDSINIWDGGYPSGGNYWKGYGGYDFFSGVSQNITGADGIGDISYVIDENNVDRYPLMRPVAVTILGDVNYDSIVNIYDIITIASVYSYRQNDSGWIPEADLAPPYGTVNMLDLVTCAAHYGEKYP